MRRIILLLTVGAVVAAMMALSGGVAFAAPQAPENCSFEKGKLTCVTTEVTQTTEQEVTQETETVVTQTTRSCQVGNSGRVGTQAGTLTETYLVTTTKTYLVTTTTTTTEVFRGSKPNPNKLLSTDTVTETTRELQSTETTRVLQSSEFTPTGDCKNISGPQK